MKRRHLVKLTAAAAALPAAAPAAGDYNKPFATAW